MADSVFQKAPDERDARRTITLTGQDVRAAARLLTLIANGSDRTAQVTRSAMVDRAQSTFLNRRRRVQLFGAPIFGEPAWDMLLTLYITEPTTRRQTLGRLVAFSGVSMTTALRWLDRLVADGLIQREDHPTDARTFFISLSEAGRDRLDAYFSETHINEF
jgi:DNA-binding MarR family transcriptional regulator